MRYFLPLLGMIATVAVILVLAWLVTRWVSTRGIGGFPGGGMGTEFCVLRQISVGRTERLLLVRMNEQCLLLGVTSGSITVLKELNEEEAAVWLTPKEPPAEQRSFLEVLKENLGRKK